jgi:anti-sigma regulatory factor (Ser/Thr protein kinase)
MIRVPVEDRSRVAEARRLATAEARRVGLEEGAVERAALLATELATNLVAYARDGEILLRGAPGDAPRLDLIALDAGPGVPSFERAMADGFSTGGGLGLGLGSLSRLGDALDMHSDPLGTVTAVSVGPGAAAALAPQAGLTQPKPGETACGDGWAARPGPEGRLLMLLDALGHGARAAETARPACAAFHEAQGGLEETTEAVLAALGSGRGAALVLAEARDAEGVLRAWGIGNIRGELFRGRERSGIVSASGVAGRGARRRPPLEHPWSADSVLILATDGLREAPRHAAPPALRARSALVVAAAALKRRRRGGDDSGVAVMKGVSADGSA